MGLRPDWAVGGTHKMPLLQPSPSLLVRFTFLSKLMHQHESGSYREAGINIIEAQAVTRVDTDAFGCWCV